MGVPVTVVQQPVELPTYAPAPPDRYPQFLEKRVYQGSSGRVYPLAICDRIATRPEPRAWQAVFIENEYLRVMILPELGGRIHRIVDKPSGQDLIYYQPVIKPALVGLAGPWVSGGIEFNWPQHHRPSTVLPTTVSIEQTEEGSATVWLSEHDPIARMKGMHGVCLRPGVARVELRVRVYNRTDDVQTFLWWANAGLEAHEQVQSFFPPDVTYVADHARRAMSTFPLCEGSYYGVDYAARARKGVPAAELPRRYFPARDGDGAMPPPNDLSWYANIPVPTSYMCLGSRGDFCGAYDHRARVGLVHVANHHLAPGKKQWTWGNHEFGYAWDRNLTDPRPDGSHPPYIELMAGVFTDNQPDFSYLQPGETKTWSQYWYPIHDLGVPREANVEAAVDLRQGNNARQAEARVAVTRAFPGARVQLAAADGSLLAETSLDLAPGPAAILSFKLPGRAAGGDLQLVVRDREQQEIIRFRPTKPTRGVPPPAATAPALPADIASADELYLIGLHLEQYRHATRCPTSYWQEALRRDPADSRCNLALGRWHLRRGEFTQAERYLHTAVVRLTSRNPNPADGEAYYQLGRCLRYLGRTDEATGAYWKATWNQAWAGMAFLALAEFAVARGEWAEADGLLTRARRLDEDNLRVRNLQAIVYERCGLDDWRRDALDAVLRTDPQDAWANWLRHGRLPNDNQVLLDVAHDLARSGLWSEGLDVLARASPDPAGGSLPLVNYTRAWMSEQQGRTTQAKRYRAAARIGSVERCFPARLEEEAILRAAITANPEDARARRLLGFWLYDRRRHDEAIVEWEQAVRTDPTDAVVWRCLGIAYFNIRRRPTRAKVAYERALQAAPTDARLYYERDQLWKRLGVAPERRLAALRKVRARVDERDDLAVEFAALLNQTGRPDEALALLQGRSFQPWEGGEGLASREYVRARLLLGRAALAQRDPAAAREHFTAALETPPNLGEARHLLVNPAEVHWWLGEAWAALGDLRVARKHWEAAARSKGDFQGMRVRTFSETSFFSARAMRRLGRRVAADALLHGLQTHARQLARTPPEIDYFATSLPTMLLFDDDLKQRQSFAARLFEAQAKLGRGQKRDAVQLLTSLLREDPANAAAADLRTFLAEA